MKTCRNGLHTYDSAEHAECPECRRATKLRYSRQPKNKARNLEYQRQTRDKKAAEERASRPAATHKTCRKYGHQYALNRSACPECQKRRMAIWKLAHPDRDREWRERNADALRVAERKRRNEKRQLLRDQDRAWRKANPDKVRAAKKRHYLKYRDQIIAYTGACARVRYAANPGAERAKVLAKFHKRRARLRDACSPGMTPDQWRDICARFQDTDGNTRCAYCDKSCAATIDHVVPIARGGRDESDNVLPACRSCNSSKRDRLISEWERARQLLAPALYELLVSHTNDYLKTLSAKAA